MQLVKGLIIVAIATALCISPTTAADSVDATESKPNVPKLYYTKFPTPSPAINGRKLYYTKVPTPSPAANDRK
ncbi:hypothetical protein PC121_g24519 [Phytophthora cactorum]|nr:hypothetical protein PC120_g21921 [Phytophthora cactorum]KAG3029972.1 hypothetical protein PC121_g24519 [Phytophthora cactorum]KAG4041034.1 hypothetical protein PC123_g23439 [Phytophthora cactorum]